MVKVEGIYEHESSRGYGTKGFEYRRKAQVAHFIYSATEEYSKAITAYVHDS